MATTTISPKFQIVIPKEVWDKLRLSPRQRLQVVEKGRVITLVPEVPLKSLKGVLKGMSKTDVRKRRTECEGRVGFQRVDRIIYRQIATPPISPLGFSSSRQPSSCTKYIRRSSGSGAKEMALLFAGRLNATEVAQLTESIAYLAADLRHGLAMADAKVYATAQDQEAEVVTGDADLKNLSGVVYVK